MNQIFLHAARNIRLLCNALSTPVVLDAPRFEDSYVSFDLKISHGIEADFFIRAQGVGITCKGEDLPLFYLLQELIRHDGIQLEVRDRNGVRAKFYPKVAGDYLYSMQNPCKYYLAGITTGNLKGWTDLIISRDPETFEDRADFLANLLWTQFIVKMMPHIETYKMYKKLGLLTQYKVAEEKEQAA